jgi:hypothetical protein
MKVYVHTLAYNKPEFVQMAGENLRVTAGTDRYEYVIFDCGYPLPSEKENSSKLKKIADKLKAGYVKIENEGVAQNWNKAIEHFNPSDDDIVVGMDPDSRADTLGWLRDMKTAFQKREDAFYIGMNRTGFEEYKRGTLIEGEVNLLKFNELVAWSMGGFRVKMIKEIGGIGQYNGRYGYIEHYCYDKLKPMGYDFYLLADHFDLSLDSPDPQYSEWKQASASRNTDLKFNDWLRTR